MVWEYLILSFPLFVHEPQLNLEPLQIQNLQLCIKFFFTSVNNQIVRPSKDLTGQNLFLTGHCPLTGRYFKPCQ